MAIRIREVDGYIVALCAAETDCKEGDIYLCDGSHHALSTKFALDFQSEGLLDNPPLDLHLVELMASQRLRDAEQELLKWIKEQEKK